MPTLSRTINKISALEGVLATPADVREMSKINLLQQGGTASHPVDSIEEFQMACRTESSILRRPFMDENEGEERFALALHKMGYREPKWWQYWRWSEWKLSETVRDRLAALEAEEK